MANKTEGVSLRDQLAAMLSANPGLLATVTNKLGTAAPQPAANKAVPNVVPPKPPAKPKAEKTERKTRSTAARVGNIVTLTLDLSDPSIYYDADNNERLDKNGNRRPYVQWALPVTRNGKDYKIVFGASIPDLE